MAGRDPLVAAFPRRRVTAMAPAGDSAELLEELLEHGFRDRGLLERALTHASLRRGAGSYERLEFVGDRVLALIVADLLAERFPDATEGQLAKRHARLVSRDVLAEIGDSLSLPRFIRAEDAGDPRHRESVVADCCEAVIGAIYRDGGIEAARTFVARRWQAHLAADAPRVPTADLQEWLQERGLPLPEYRVVARTGADHEPSFTIEVSAEGQPPARASGPSKRVARTRAAERMLRRIGSGA